MSEDSEKYTFFHDLKADDVVKAAELIAKFCPATLIADALIEERAATRPNKTLRDVLTLAFCLRTDADSW